MFPEHHATVFEQQKASLVLLSSEGLPARDAGEGRAQDLTEAFADVGAL